MKNIPLGQKITIVIGIISLGLAFAVLKYNKGRDARLQDEGNKQILSELRSRLNTISTVESKSTHLNKENETHVFPDVTENTNAVIKQGSEYFDQDKIHAADWAKNPESQVVKSRSNLDKNEQTRAVKAFEIVVGLSHKWAIKYFGVNELERSTQIFLASSEQNKWQKIRGKILEAQKQCEQCLKLEGESAIASCIAKATEGLEEIRNVFDRATYSFLFTPRLII